MGRTRMYFKYEISSSVVGIVRAVCADYQRRERALRLDDLNGSVKAEYTRLNGCVERAISAVTPCELRDELIKDIAFGRGYDFSPCSPFLAKNTYYQRKKQIVHDIAVNLMLI